MSNITTNSNWSNKTYTNTLLSLPMLSEEDEQKYSRAYKFQDCLKSAEKLVLAHLKLVYSVSKQFMGYNLPQDDLIQEGTIGLMKATKRFDPDAGVRLAAYAIIWIKAEINAYILKNWRLVKVATTKAQHKLFFNLRSMKVKYDSLTGVTLDTLTAEQVKSMAAELDVTQEDVREMEMRLRGNEFSLDPVQDSSDDVPMVYSEFIDLSNEPTSVIEMRKLSEFSSVKVQEAISLLNEREQRIIFSRYVDVSDSGQGLTFKDLSEEFGVSMERIRQIEVAAIKKMKKYLESCATSIV